MRTKSIFLAAGVLTMSLAPIGSGLMTASAQMYDWTTIAGTVTNIGSADGTNNVARFNYPTNVAADTNGNLYVSDTSNDTIRKITLVGTNWVVSTIAGSVGNTGSADGTNSNARFKNPRGIAVDAAGNVYVADLSNYTYRKITPIGGTNYVTTTIAGTATISGTADGTNSNARFDRTYGVALDTNGNLYVTDMGNCTIRKITPLGGTNWVTTTIAGSSGSPGTNDGINNAARFNYPYGIARDTNGNLYVADQYSSTIRKVAPVGTNWVTTTIAGLAGVDDSADGTNSDARFHTPVDVKVDTKGNLYVLDMNNFTIRKVAPVGTNWVTTSIGGKAGHHGSTDGLDGYARFYPYGLGLDSADNLYVADSGNDTIRLGVPMDILTIVKETAKVNFNPAKTNSDSCALTTTLDLGAGYNLTNLVVSMDIGGADAWFKLDAKGKGHGIGTNGTYGTCKLSYKKNTGPWTFTASLKKGSWATPWGTYGLTNYSTTAKAGDSVTLPVVLGIGDDVFFAGDKALLYKAKAGKSGTAK